MIEENSLFGLDYCCPHLERKVDCPLKQVEHLSFQEKVRWINSLSEKEKEAMFGAT